MRSGRPTTVGYLSIIASLLAASTIGCGRDGPQMHEVGGTLTHQGKPVPKMMVKFSPVDASNSPASAGSTDGAGKFVMMVGNTKGVAQGTYIVSVQDFSALHGEPPSKGNLALVKKYGDERKSPYKITVEDDMHDFEPKLD